MYLVLRQNGSEEQNERMNKQIQQKQICESNGRIKTTNLEADSIKFNLYPQTWAIYSVRADRMLQKKIWEPCGELLEGKCIRAKSVDASAEDSSAFGCRRQPDLRRSV